MTDKLVKPQRVAARLDCGITQAKFKMRNDLGGWYEPGIGWRCTERALNAFIASRAKGAQCDYPSSSDQPRPDGTGTATSALLTIADSNALSTSETTGAQNQERLQSLPSGTSKHAQRMASLIAKHARAARSEKRSRRSPENKTSQD